MSSEAPSVSADGLTLTVANGPIADWNFDGVVDASDIAALTVGGVGRLSMVTAVDAALRTITVSQPVPGLSEVRVSYYYVKDHIIEVDQLAPAVIFDPPIGPEFATGSPLVKILFDDDEYIGDSFKTVTMTKADLTKPDATTVSVLPEIVTSDSIEHTWRASDLVTGAYTLTISAKDAAGNELRDVAYPFTIANVAPVVEAGLAETADEGSIVTLAATFTDANTTDTHTPP